MEGEAGDGDKEMAPTSLILNTNGSIAHHEEDADERANNVKHGRHPTVPPDPQSSAFKTVHVPVKRYHPGFSENPSAFKVRFEFMKQKHEQIGILACVIRFLFAPLRLVRWVLVGLLGKLVRM